MQPEHAIALDIVQLYAASDVTVSELFAQLSTECNFYTWMQNASWQGWVPGSGMSGNDPFSLLLEPGHDLLLNLPLHRIEEEARVLQAPVDSALQP